MESEELESVKKVYKRIKNIKKYGELEYNELKHSE